MSASEVPVLNQAPPSRPTGHVGVYLLEMIKSLDPNHVLKNAEEVATATIDREIKCDSKRRGGDTKVMLHLEGVLIKPYQGPSSDQSRGLAFVGECTEEDK